MGLRVKLGDNDEYKWDEFSEAVDHWFGDPFRQNFIDAVHNNEEHILSEKLQPIQENDAFTNVFTVKNYKDKPNQFPELEFLKNALKLIKKEKKNPGGKKRLKKKKKKKKKS